MIQHRSLKVQLSAVFLSFLSLLIFLGLLSIHELSDVNRASVDIRDHWLQSTRILGDLTNYTSDYRAAEASHLLAWSPELIASTEREITELGQAITLAKTSYERIPQRQSEREIYARFHSDWENYQTVARQVIDLSRANRKEEGGRLYMSSSRVEYAKASDALAELTSRTVTSAGEASGVADVTHEYARKLIIGAIILAAVSMVGVLQYINRSISRPLLELAAKMRSLASNVLDIEIHSTHRHDEIGEMARSVVVFRKNALELAESQRGLMQQATMLEEKLEYEKRLSTVQRNFLAMASHEFRTPLTIIDGHAQRLVKMQTELQPQDIAERATKIRSAVLRMTSVMDNLLTSSRLFDGDPALYFHPTQIDIAKLLHDVCHVHREIWPGVQIYENFRLLPKEISGDRHLLFQVFSNLLSNAIKYSPKGGLITVKGVTENDTIVVITEDRGIGVPEADRTRLFDRYHRGSNVSGIAGTGIGLYLVKMVVTLHNGAVSVASVEGHGSEFTVRLPINRSLCDD